MITGIILQWYLQSPIAVSIVIFVVSGAVFFMIGALRNFKSWKWAPLRGLMMVITLITFGMMLTWLKDVRHQNHWLGKSYQTGDMLVARLEEPLVAKERSYKAVATVRHILKSGNKSPVSGNIIIYFKKDSINASLRAGDRILIAKDLQEIHNAGNPGGFDYERYALFNGITHQVYLTDKGYEKLPGNGLPWYQSWLLQSRNYVLSAIKAHIKGAKEQGLAEAMLIGYKDDLDKSLLQSYTNTGVVHVIAVSGMHLALLYWLLNLLFAPLLRRKKTKWLHAVLVLAFLWFFSLITGGAASIVRAAVMFTFITVGKQINRNASIYNILAVSAFCQFCYNPYWLWDVGFQLSYAAVLSIVVFYKPIYNLLFVKNKILHAIWQLAAVSIAAQILTTPIALYYFHQFPVYFLLSNLVVVPVSTVVLVATLVLVLLSPIKIIAAFIGSLLNGLIWWLNTFIERMEDFPLAVWWSISINLAQSLLLFVLIAGIAFWLMAQRKSGFWWAMSSLCIFLLIRAASFYDAGKQQKLIVYNANRYAAMDIISGRYYSFYGDTEALTNGSVMNYVMNPCRILHRSTAEQVQKPEYSGNVVLFHNKKVLCINQPLRKSIEAAPLSADLVILSGNPRLYISDLLKKVKPSQIVIDGSVPAWKARYWLRDCDSLQIACHNVATSGAFVMSLY
ncbi:ComEC/Rec2 family competence protein [Niabella yanshanensis]|uniref:ComEC/Rec2 family competence protein n=1 Tax=Niabella yanshanensis TaxID=577386 RepID=A0ABZ0WBF3_9BACT|nr:ComEC/Rec2 family competence protein [Niabella yanshanensis]WQD40638.1 ComEC/Rec2 family competence protein [Niabella yanshanensis]